MIGGCAWDTGEFRHVLQLDAVFYVEALDDDGCVAALDVGSVDARAEAPAVALAHRLELVEAHQGHRGKRGLLHGGGRAIAGSGPDVRSRIARSAAQRFHARRTIGRS